MIRTGVVALLVLLVGMAGDLRAQEQPQPDGQQQARRTHVLVVKGIIKDPEAQEANDRAVEELREFFLKTAGLPDDQVTVLASGDSATGRQYGESTAENLQQTLKVLAGSIGPADRFVFYYVGQANVVVRDLRFNLPGPDVTHEELGEWIGPVEAAEVLIVLDCPGAGLAVPGVSGEGRIVVCGSRPDQPYATRFSEHFIPALADPESDENGDGRASVLEAFTRACGQLDELDRQEGVLNTETPLLEDDGDGIPSERPWQYEEEKRDGEEAAGFFLVDAQPEGGDET